MDLSVVIPTLGRSPATPALLDALAGQDAGGLAVEVILVDDSGSARPAVHPPPLMKKPWPVRILRHARNLGRAAACNTGARAASGRLLLFLDDDLVLRDRSLLAGHAAAHGEAPEAVLGMVSIAPGLGGGPWGFYLKRNTERLNRLKSRLSLLRDGFLCETGNCSIPRSLFLDLGGFDAAFRRYGYDDVEFGLRLLRRGGTIRFRPDLEVLHRTDMTTLSTLARKSFGRGFNAVHAAEAHPYWSAELGVRPYRAAPRRAFLRSRIHLLLYPAWIPLAHAAFSLGWTWGCLKACERIGFTWRMRGLLQALREERACA